MDCCGRSQKRAKPQTLVGAAEKPRSLSPCTARVNGWSRPVDWYQMASWANIFITAVTIFGIFIPFLPYTWRIIAYAVIGGLFFMHLVVHVITVTIDPAEANVRLKKYYLDVLPSFDRSEQQHIIEDQYCHLGEVTPAQEADRHLPNSFFQKPKIKTRQSL
uniref:Uncharacterized protein n=1 Tax=Prolemur simus TaxID=1328070 RepID=A0A8C8Z7W4_PROSS